MLRAPNPMRWRAEHVAARSEEEGHVPSGGAAGDVSLAGLLADDAAHLRAGHSRLVERATPAPAAACYLAGWFAGGLADVVGFGLAAGGAGFLPEPASVRYTLHPDGWPTAVTFTGATVVDASHPWAASPGVDAVGSGDAVIARTVAHLVALVTPVIEACRGLANVGSVGLWNEVGDALGSVLSFQLLAPPTAAMVDVLRRAVRQPGVPWRAAPRLDFAASTVLGPVHVAQKGGCCLAYTAAVDGVAEGEGETEVDPDDLAAVDRAAYLARFPDRPGEPRYCSTCSFRDRQDCDARQVFWLERRQARRVEARSSR